MGTVSLFWSNEETAILVNKTALAAIPNSNSIEVRYPKGSMMNKWQGMEDLLLNPSGSTSYLMFGRKLIVEIGKIL